MKSLKGKRADRVMNIEFPDVESKKAFFDYCYRKGHVPSKIARLLMDMYAKGKIKLFTEEQ